MKSVTLYVIIMIDEKNGRRVSSAENSGAEGVLIEILSVDALRRISKWQMSRVSSARNKERRTNSVVRRGGTDNSVRTFSDAEYACL